MITITWHLFVLIVLALVSLCIAITRSNKIGPYGISPRSAMLALWVYGVIVVFLIYGGFVWW